jgi:hypothetical protein
MSSCGMLRRVALVRTNVLHDRIASVISVTRIGELGATLAVIVFLRSVLRFLGIGILSMCSAPAVNQKNFKLTTHHRLLLSIAEV